MTNEPTDGEREPASELWTPEAEGVPEPWPPTETWTPDPDVPPGPQPPSELWTPEPLNATAAATVPSSSSYWERSWEAPPAAEAAAPFHGPPVPSPYAGLSSGPGRILATAFDVLAQANGDLRRASFYIGLVVLGTLAPLALLTWRVIVEVPNLESMFAQPSEPVENAALGSAYLLAIGIGIAGFLVAAIESRGVAISVLAARLGGRSLDLRDAVQRSRTVFWRLFWATLLAGIPLTVVQSLLQSGLGGIFGVDSEGAVLSSTLLATFLFSPLAYVQTGVVLGDVGPLESLRRSIRLFRARRILATVVALFEFGSQFILLFALGAGLDLVGRVIGASGLGSTGSSTDTAVIVALIVILLFAIGTLLLTVAAIAVAPQVAAFLALTHASPGLDRIGGVADRFRWMPRPMLAGMAGAVVALVLGVGSLG